MLQAQWRAEGIDEAPRATPRHVIIERMCEELEAGDRIVWYADAIGRPATPDDPGAQRREGTITVVHRGPDGRVTAYFVERVGMLGAYAVTVRLEHHPVRA